MKRYIVFSIIFLMSFIGIIQAETYKPGDVITYKDINDTEFKIGDMVEYNGKEFYVIKNASKTDDKLTMVSKLPLSYEYLQNLEGVNYSTLVRGTIVLEDNKEYYPGYVEYYENKYQVCDVSHHDGCDNNYDKSFIKPIVDEWADKFFEDKLTEDEMGYKARLLTVDDLKDKLGYVVVVEGSPQTESYQVSEDTPFILTNCWTMTPVSDSNYLVSIIANDGNKSLRDVYYEEAICPVVTIKKQVATNNESKINDQDNDNKNFIEKIFVPNTLLKNPIFIAVSGIILIVAATVIVSLTLKKKNNKKNKL